MIKTLSRKDVLPTAWSNDWSLARLEKNCDRFARSLGWNTHFDKAGVFYAQKGSTLIIVNCFSKSNRLTETKIADMAAVNRNGKSRSIAVVAGSVTEAVRESAEKLGVVILKVQEFGAFEESIRSGKPTTDQAVESVEANAIAPSGVGEELLQASVAEPKILVLGDSRTGTMTLHRYFEVLGISSIHWYVNQSEQLKPPHEHVEENWKRCRDFINTSGYRAFSDYPTRTYYRELLREYPDALFILSTRKDLETWRKSMLGFFSKFDIPLDIEKLSANYLRVNEKIRLVMQQAGARFLEICIDDGAERNSAAIKEFLGIESPLEMGWENQTAGYENNITSRRAQFFSAPTSDVISYAEAMCRDTKALPSEKAWLFLINDANDFLRYQFGPKALTDGELERAASMIRKRAEVLSGKSIAFRNFIVPEKSVVYREFLPTAFDKLEEVVSRPAQRLAEAVPDTVHYLADYLKDLKSYGLLYFRGDTHANWLGAYFVYRYVIEHVNRALTGLGRFGKGTIIPPLPIARMASVAVDYDGDLRAQLLPKHLEQYQSVWKFLQPARTFERLLRYYVPEAALSTTRVATPEDYAPLEQQREIFVREHKNTALPRAVIFRDSTADFLVELLAEHFSRSVFIWYKGLLIQDVIDRERPDVVIHLSAERFVWIYSQQPPFAPIPQS